MQFGTRLTKVTLTLSPQCLFLCQGGDGYPAGARMIVPLLCSFQLQWTCLDSAVVDSSQSLPYQIEFKWNTISVCILCLCQLPNGFFQCIIHCDVLGDFWVLCLKESSNSLHIVTSHEFLYIADLWCRVAINIPRIK